MDSVRIVLLALLVLIAGPALAGGVGKLYSAEMLVAGQGGQPDESDVKQGLAQVLLKVSGDRALLEHEEVIAELERSRVYLQRFGFTPTQQVVKDENGQAVRGYRLLLEYDARAVRSLLAAADRKPLGVNRPTLMIWVAVQDEGPRDYLAPGSEIYRLLRSEAQRRGLPLQFPLLDLTDQQALPVADVWGLFADSLEDGSRRYRTDAVLAGRLVRSGTRWQSEWVLVRGEEQQRISSGGELKQLLAQVVDTAADSLFASLSGEPSAQADEGIRLQIANVDSLSDYAEILGYIRAIPVVEQAVPASITQDSLVLRLSIDGGVDQLTQSMGLQPRFAPEPGLDAVAGLSYSWRR
ncbi:DUF2066 domain-containing protein [Marinobacterium jannaschii]|uniref:DUF2066 domain-containing protein n=1 Tax=Marinobacterium jannaschii TaxID=64970 RepID=UPI00047FF87A|nr:DUF2066 domain-containing protein [Marinobacterium jannaschii]